MKKIIFILTFVVSFIGVKLIYTQSNDCAGPSGEIHDDGTFENGYVLSGDSVRFVTKIQPAQYPWRYNRVCIGWTRNASGPAALNYEVMVYSVGQDGKPGFLMKAFLGQQVSDIPVLPGVKWNSTDVSFPILVAGYCYIGVRYVNNPQLDVFIASDESQGTQRWPGYSTNQSEYFQHWIPIDSQWSNYKSMAIRMDGEPGVDAVSCVNPVGAEIHDDGIFEGGHTGAYDSTRIVQKFQPPEYPWKYTKACIGWSRLTGSPVNLTVDYDIIVYDDSGPGGRPGNLVALIPGQRVIKIPDRLECKWNPTDLNIPVLNSGAYYIGVRYDGLPQTGIYMPRDLGPTTPLWPGYHSKPVEGWVRNDSEWTGHRSSAIRTEGTSLIGIHEINTGIPETYLLEQNYPNPFNPITTIRFQIVRLTDVKLNIYDQLGREVTSLVNEELKAGTYEVFWDASNYSSGVYFYKIITSEFSETKKMVLMK